MKNLLLFIICLIGQLAFSQTKTETEDWIKNKIEAAGLTGNQEYDIYYDDEHMSIGNKTSFSGFTLHMGYLVKIKCIRNFYFKEYESALHLIIKTSSDCKIQQNDFTNKTIEEVTFVTIILDKS